MKAWLVNSNNNEDNGNPNGYRYMLQQNRVIAYYDRRAEINKIQNGDLVLLYHNQTGIIAVGYALNSDFHDFEDITKVENWVNINWIWKVRFNNNSNLCENPIDRKLLGITNVYGTVIEINNLETLNLLEEIGKRQSIFC
jgi:hypothetical protein